MKYILVPLALLILISCGEEKKHEDLEGELEETESPLAFDVQHAGALKNFMHKKDVSAKIDMAEIENNQHLFALGAAENLKGEILIWDGEPYVSTVVDDQVNIDHSYQHKASLLVYSSVEKWSNFEVDAKVKTYNELEEFVAQTADENGIDISQPFPFLLKGAADTLSWHVIDWAEGDTVHTHQKHIESGLNGMITDVQTEILGFYSDSHHAIFTHHSTNMHLHFNCGDTLAGHVDGLTLGEGMELSIPRIK